MQRVKNSRLFYHKEESACSSHCCSEPSRLSFTVGTTSWILPGSCQTLVCLSVAGDTLLITQHNAAVHPLSRTRVSAVHYLTPPTHTLAAIRRARNKHRRRQLSASFSICWTAWRQEVKSCTWLSMGEGGGGGVGEWVGTFTLSVSNPAPTCIVAGSSSNVAQVGFKEVFKTAHLSLDPSAVGRPHLLLLFPSLQFSCVCIVLAP